MVELDVKAGLTFRDIEPFSTLPHDILATLDAETGWVRVPAGHPVIDGTLGGLHGVFALAEGEVEIHHPGADGRPVLLGRLSAATWFGEFAVLRGRPSWASVLASTPCLLAEIPAERFLDLLHAHPSVALPLLKRAVSVAGAIDDALIRQRSGEQRLAEIYAAACIRSL